MRDSTRQLDRRSGVSGAQTGQELRRRRSLASLRGMLARARRRASIAMCDRPTVTDRSAARDGESGRQAEAAFVPQLRSPRTPVAVIEDSASLPDSPKQVVTYVLWTIQREGPGRQENGLFRLSNN